MTVPARRLLIALTVGLGAATLAPVAARAQVITEPAPPPPPDPSKFARGFFASGELGALVFLGHTGRYAGPGPAFGVRLGYDLFRWMAIQAHVAGASSDADTPPPTSGQAFQTLLYMGELRFTARIRRVALFAEGGAGAAQLTSNVLDLVNITRGQLFSLAVVGGGGIDYHTLNRHFSVGLDADYIWMQGFSKTSSLTASAYLRYTK